MTHTLHLHHRHESDKHRDNIMASLAHRLDVARASNNVSLVTLLEREQHEIAPEGSSSVARSQRNWWESAAQHIRNALFGGSELQVSEIVDGRDRWWVASDPQTGQFVYADSEAELRLWIEDNYQGR